MKKLMISLLLAAIPFLIPITVYLVTDPFMVVWHYKSFNREKGRLKMFQLDRDYVGIELLLNKYDSFKYDSYIFGNSNARVYKLDEWRKQIKCTNCFHLDAYGENIFGIAGKMNLLHKKGIKIKNALVIMDSSILYGTGNMEGTVFRKHPLVSGEPRMAFQLTMFKYFMERDCFLPFVKSIFVPAKNESALTRSAQDKQDNAFFDNRNDEDKNEETNVVSDAAIERNADSFYNSRKKMVFYDRPPYQRISQKQIYKRQLELLGQIKKIFDEDGTNYRIIISPRYEQMKMHPSDVATLQEIFGKNKVFDMSGINDITNDMRNYYEYVHYRPTVAKRIMDSIYSN